MDTEQVEIRILLKAIELKYGYDFSNYALAAIKRKLIKFLPGQGLDHIYQLQHQILHNEAVFERLLTELAFRDMEMFRDPGFFVNLRENVVPLLKTYPNIRIWYAGCSRGEEVYALAILLLEENLLERSLIYATDIDENLLKDAKEGIFPLDKMKSFTNKYQKAGGRSSFSDYYTARYQAAIMAGKLKKNIVFSQHSLANDQVFAEVHMVICRNWLIYFNPALQERAVGLFHDSLVRGGILCLGRKEDLKPTSYRKQFKAINDSEKIFRKIAAKA
jgi:chemotaxis protein methyltransferase CheR